LSYWGSTAVCGVHWNRNDRYCATQTSFNRRGRRLFCAELSCTTVVAFCSLPLELRREFLVHVSHPVETGPSRRKCRRRLLDTVDYSRRPSRTCSAQGNQLSCCPATERRQLQCSSVQIDLLQTIVHHLV